MEGTNFFGHVVPVLGGVDTGFEGGGPGCGVYCGTFVFRAGGGLPIDEEGDCVLGLRHAVVGLAGGDTCCGTGDDSGWDCFILQDPAADIDVVGREVVAA